MKNFDFSRIKRIIKSSNPKCSARATMIGLGLSFAPIPFQMPMVFFVWIIAKKIKWKFSLIIALAWTFVSNWFTNLPLFYLYYKTGALFFGCGKNIDYQIISNIYKTGSIEKIYVFFEDVGLCILCGSLVYMFLGFLIGYPLGYKIAKMKFFNEGKDV